jgi:16S rRNA (guanine527-N7)-methyltransferase
VLALKGESAAAEVATHQGAVTRAGGSSPAIRLCGVGMISPPTTVVEVTRLR